MLDDLYFDDWASPVEGTNWASTDYPTDAIGNYAFDDAGVGNSYPPPSMLSSFDTGQIYDYPTDAEGNYVFDDWAQSNSVPASQVSPLEDVPTQGVLSRMADQAKSSWERDPWRWISTIGGGLLGLYSGITQQNYYKKLIEEQRKRQQAAAAALAQSNRPLFQGRPASDPSVFQFPVTDWSRYGSGPEATFRTSGPSFSRADFAGAAGGPLSSLVSGPGGGQDDNLVGRLSAGEFVVPADVVSDLGDGSNDEGSNRLLGMLRRVRQHKGRPKRLPPKAKSPAAYLKKGA